MKSRSVPNDNSIFDTVLRVVFECLIKWFLNLAAKRLKRVRLNRIRKFAGHIFNRFLDADMQIVATLLDVESVEVELVMHQKKSAPIIFSELLHYSYLY